MKLLDNIIDINSLFKGCKALESIKFNYERNKKYIISNMASLFYGCSSLKHLPYIFNCDISRVKAINELFYECKSLKYLPDISKWDLNKIQEMQKYFVDVLH